MNVLRDIPFSMNAGVMAHEYAHRVWYYEAWGGTTLCHAANLDGSTDLNALQNMLNLINALDEGVADFFGALVFGSPNFLAPSVFAELAAPRDLSQARQIEATWLSGQAPVVESLYNPYAIGSVLASMLWSFGGDRGPAGRCPSAARGPTRPL